MSLFVMRSNKRYAVRQSVSLDHPAGPLPMDALLIEISLEGCRISHLGSDVFEMGQAATVVIDGFGPLHAKVRWSHDLMLGLRFDNPLHSNALGQLLAMCRSETGIADPTRAYGT